MSRATNHPTTRDLPVEPAHTTLLFIDVQNYCAVREGGEFKDMTKEEFQSRLGWFFDQMEQKVVPNMQRLQAGCRKAGIEVMYTVIQNLTRDGRHRSLDYKITGFNVPKGSSDAKVIRALEPGDDEASAALHRPVNPRRAAPSRPTRRATNGCL